MLVEEWICHICGAKRKDEFISVHSKDISKELNLEPGTAQQNVRYCNDKIECRTKALTHNFFKGKKK